jgi:hypothetical protein
MFADALRRVQRYTDKQFAAYGLDAQAAAALRQTPSGSNAFTFDGGQVGSW